MIQIEIDWSDYTDYKVEAYRRRYKGCPELLTEEEIKKVRQSNQPPTYSISYGINPYSVASYKVYRETVNYYWYNKKYDDGVASGSCIIDITFTSGRAMKLFCYDDAADKIVKMLQGEKSGKTVKVSGVKEYEIHTETNVNSMP